MCVCLLWCVLYHLIVLFILILTLPHMHYIALHMLLYVCGCVIFALFSGWAICLWIWAWIFNGSISSFCSDVFAWYIYAGVKTLPVKLSFFFFRSTDSDLSLLAKTLPAHFNHHVEVFAVEFSQNGKHFFRFFPNFASDFLSRFCEFWPETFSSHAHGSCACAPMSLRRGCQLVSTIDLPSSWHEWNSWARPRAITSNSAWPVCIMFGTGYG